MPLSTPLSAALRVRHPIQQAPMAGGWTTAELVAAVSNAGGLGNIAAARTTVATLETLIRGVRSATDRPFGVNFLLAPPEPPPADIEAVQDVLDQLRLELGLPPGPRELRLPPSVLEEQFQLVLDAYVPVVSFAMGHPRERIDRARGAGAFVMVTATTVEEAVAAEKAGANAVIAQGIEAGGHRGTFDVPSLEDLPQVGTFTLVPQIVDAVNVPVVAAGGIMDGRGVAAALALGAQGCQLGTRFLLATESGAWPAYRRLITQGTEVSTRLTRFFTGRPARGFRNRLLEALERSGVEPLPWPYQALAADDLFRHAIDHGGTDTMVLLAGQGLRMAGRETGARDIVESLVREAEAVITSLSNRPASPAST